MNKTNSKKASHNRQGRGTTLRQIHLHESGVKSVYKWSKELIILSSKERSLLNYQAALHNYGLSTSQMLNSFEKEVLTQHILSNKSPKSLKIINI